MPRPLRFGVAVCPVLMVGVLLAQQARPVFEVASVKRSYQTEAHGATIMHEFSNGRVNVEANTISLIQAAYGVRNDQLSGGPGWIFNDYYSVIAKAERPVGASEMWPMMVPLLEERFHLKVHREKRQVLVYKLSAASGGLKLKEGACVSWAERGPEPAYARGATRPLPCGRLIAYLVEQGTAIEVVGGKVSMPSLAEFLTRQWGRLVIDETGYKGTFDIHLKVSSDDWHHGVSSNPDPSGLPTASGAMRELGIKVELVKGPVETLVIDSIERPNPN